MPHHDHCDHADCDHEDHAHAEDDHVHSPLDELVTVRDLIRYATTRFNRAGLYFGHGLQDAYDEAVYLVLHALALPLDRLEPFLDACIPSDERADVLAAIHRRADERVPAAYITNEAWLGDFRFYVDERVIVPRSFCAELIEVGFTPWIADPDAIGAGLDLCTGSGCLAILMALRFPAARIDAVDLSPDALEVAQLNVAEYGLADRVHLLQSDVYDALGDARYDIILSNPPYVTTEAMGALPDEYCAEPALALDGGEDGMDIVRRIVAGARDRLNPGGILVIEVGHNRAEFEAAFPSLECVWLDTAGGDEKVLLVTAESLARL